MAQYDPLAYLNYYNVSCGLIFTKLPPGYNYWPQIRTDLQLQDPLQGGANMHIFNYVAMEDLYYGRLNQRFENLNRWSAILQDRPQWRDLWVRLDQFRGEEVNEENRVEAKYIRDLYYDPVVEKIEDDITYHSRNNYVFFRLVFTMAPTLAGDPLNSQRANLAQRKVFAILLYLDRLRMLLTRADRITENYHIFIG